MEKIDERERQKTPKGQQIKAKRRKVDISYSERVMAK